MTIELNALQQQRRDTAANWTGANPTLLNGELGYETDTGKFKIGDGSTAWTSLSHLPIPDVNGLIPIDQLLLPAGTAAAPSLTFTGDVDTGVYSVGANSFGISTAGTAALTIDSSQRVGIGTTLPQRNLHIHSSDSSTNTYLQLTSATTGSSSTDGFQLWAYGNGGNLNAAIAQRENADLEFWTNNTERLRIDSSGFIHQKFTSNNSSTPEGLFINNQNNATGNNASLIFSNDSGNRKKVAIAAVDVGNYGASDLVFALDGTDSGSVSLSSDEKMRITSSGNVVIGTTSAAADSRLTVRAVSPALSLYATPGNESFLNMGDTDDHNIGRITYDNSDNSMRFDTNADERMQIDSSGQVMIGVSSSSYNFTVAGTSYRGALIGSTNGNTAALLLDGASNGDGLGGDYGSVTHLNTGELEINNRQANSITFKNTSSSTERMRIDSSGRLIVGRTSSVTSGSAADSIVQIVGKSGVPTDLGQLTIARGNSASNLTSGAEIGEIIFSDNTGGNFAQIQCSTDGTPGTNDYPGRLVFSTTADSASSPTERMRIDNRGRIFTYNSNTGNNSLTVGSAAAAGTSVAHYIGAYGATAVNTGTASFIVWTNGEVVNTNNSYGSISDAKLKENIVDANSQWNDLKAIQIRNYNFIEGQTHTQIGVVAQEVETVSPGLVSESPDRDEDGNDLGTVTKSVNYSVLYMKAVKALQEAMERIETLEQRLTDAGL